MRFVLSIFLLCAACAHVQPPRSVPARPHPLDPLTAAEALRTFEILRAHFAADASLPKQGVRYPTVSLAEPPKAAVLAWREGLPIVRNSEVQIVHPESARVWKASIELAQGRVSQLVELPRGTQPAVSEGDYRDASDALRAHQPWLAALRARGIDPAQVYVDFWAPGHFDLPPDAPVSFGEQTRLMRALSFHGTVNPYDRPIEGLVATIDLNARKVVHLLDLGARPVSADSGNAERIETLRPMRTTLPEGSDIVLEGHRVRWHGFQFQLGFHAREGLVIYDVRHGERRIAYRMALSEIYVPYGLGDPAWHWRGAFDVGEYNAGSLAVKLERNGDVPTHALLLDEQVPNDVGPTQENPSAMHALPGAIALYEREAGVLWTRGDPRGTRDTRLARELVVTWTTVIGNYLYGFDWVFKLDGTIEVVTTLNGTTLNRGTSEEAEPSAPKIANERGVYTAAPHHQHFMSFRLDLDIDGTDNGVMQMDVVPLNHATYKNAFDTTMLHFDSEGARDLAPQSARHWHIESGHQRNALGKPTGYALAPGDFAVPYSSADFIGRQRAAFAGHQLWYSKYKDGELFAAGEYPYQSTQPLGLPQYITPAEPLTPQDDVVLWYTTGFTHVARPEDHPVMPSERVSFKLLPRGFFPRNPALEVQDQRAQ